MAIHVGLITRCEVPYTLDLANQLCEAGLSVTLYLCREHTIAEVGDSENPLESLYKLGLVPRKCRVRLIQLPRMRSLRSLSVFHSLARTIREDRVDVVHLLVASDEIWFAVLPHLLHGMPVVSTMTQPTRDIGERSPFLVIWAIQKLLTMGSDHLIVNGEDQPELLRKHYQVSIDRTSFIPLSVRTTAIKMATKPVVEERATVLFFGRAVPHKGLEYLVKAETLIAHHVPDVRILIVAHGNDLERCLKMIKDADRFEIHPEFVTGSEMAEYFKRACLVVVPYLVSTSSGVLMTAYAFGKPVVASNIAGLKEYVEPDSTGLLVPPGDTKQLADAIIRLLSDNKLRQRLGARAQRWAQEWQENVTRKTVEAYEHAMMAHSTGGREAYANTSNT